MSGNPRQRAGVAALVVTYNRKELLCEALDAVLAQDAPIERVIVIDNASTDGTGGLFAPEARYDLPLVDYRHMEENLGGAGGFKEGIRAARETGCAWVWLMDDDCISEPGTLSALLRASEKVEGASFLASCVYGPGGEPMNVPAVDTRPGPNGYSDWYRELSDGLVLIRSATFVSLLVSLDAADEVGLPIASFFIWGDDSEYTMRLAGYYGPAYLVGDSRVLHKRANAKALDVSNEDDPARIRNYRRYYRNGLVVRRFHMSKKDVSRRVLWNLAHSLRMLFSGSGGWRARRARAGAAFLGTLDFLRKAYDLEDLGVLLAKVSGHGTDGR